MGWGPGPGPASLSQDERETSHWTGKPEQAGLNSSDLFTVEGPDGSSLIEPSATSWAVNSFGQQTSRLAVEPWTLEHGEAGDWG